MCDKKNSVLFTDTECVVLSPDFKLTDESHVLLKVPRKDNMYSVDLRNVIPQGGLTCLFSRQTDESNLGIGGLTYLWLLVRRESYIKLLVRPKHTMMQTSEIFKTLITSIENLIDLRVKVIRCDNGTEFKNRAMNQFCEMKGIKREFSVAKTPQQNRVAKRKNRTLIESARTMLADSKLPTTLWAEVVNTACYVQNRVLVIKPHNKTPYELFLGRKSALSFMRPIGCLVIILNTIDHLGKFDGKADEGFFIGYSTNSKAFRVFNSKTRIVEENLHVKFSEDTPNITGRNQSNGNAGTKACDDAGKTRMETVLGKDYILLPLWTQHPPFSSSSKDSLDTGFKPSREEEKKDAKDLGNQDSKFPSTEESRVNQEKEANVNSTNTINTVSSTINVAGIEYNAVDDNIVYGCADDPNIPELEEIGRFSDAEDDISGVDMNNLDTYFQVSPVPTTRIHKDHLIEQIIGDLNPAPQTRRMTRNFEEHGFLSITLEQRRNHKDIQNCLFTCFLSQEEPKKAVQALKDPSWIEAMNKKDERGIVIKNKARLVAQGYTQEEGIDYDEVFATVARIKAIRLFLAYASFKDFVVYQMDVKSAFLYGKIKEEVYVCQPPGFEDPNFPDRVYKVENALYGLHQAPRAWKKMCIEFKKMMHKKFQMSSMGELTFFLGLQVKQKEDGIFISQDKYVTEILKKFGFSDVKTASTPMETHKPLLKDADGEDVDEHLYRSMIGSLMYLTSSRPDIMFAVCACARFQVNPKISHLHAMKRIFRYLKGQPKLGLWYPKDSPFDLVAYTDNDYVGASLDRKSTTGGCQFLGCRLISRDSNAKKLIQMIKIHIDLNVADLLTKAFDVSRFQYLIAKPIADEVANEENIPTHSNDPLLSAEEIASLKRRVKKLEKKQRYEVVLLKVMLNAKKEDDEVNEVEEMNPKDLKTKSFANVQELFDKAMKRVNTFIDMDTELLEDDEIRVEGNETREESSSKRAGDELESDKSKKQKLDEKVGAEVDDAKEAEDHKQFLEIVPNDWR
ncbi:ribonuclease H-like domain-containing protein [Tanacetum coccineum]